MSTKKSPFLRLFPKISKIKAGFTLVELLISVGIFSVVSIAIFSTFASGASILRRVKNIDLTEQSLLLKAQRFERELRQQPFYKKLLLRGNKTSLSFPSSLNLLPSRVTYYFEASSGSLMRCEDKLSDIITDEGKVDPELKEKPATFITKIKEIEFSYFYFDLARKEHLWIEEWKQDALPLAIKIIISTENSKYVSTVFLPTA